MAVDSIISNAVSTITGAIQRAAQSTGISFEYLLTTARMESGLNPTAQASTSSAKGLYQFIDQTWLATMKQEGAGLGYGRYADAITQNADGRYEVSDPAMRTEIMRLRNDPATSAALAGAFSRANAARVANSIGRQPNEGELYLAHFLGPDGAAKMINAAASRPQASAASLFPAAAAANKSIFYDKSGNALSVSDVYAKLTGRFEKVRTAQFGPAQRGTPDTQVATVPLATVPAAAVAPVPVIPVASAQAGSSAPTVVTEGYAVAQATQPALVETRPLFQAMFTDRAGTPVAPVVNSLWGSSKTASNAQPPGLNLFTDAATNIRSLFGNT